MKTVKTVKPMVLAGERVEAKYQHIVLAGEPP